MLVAKSAGAAPAKQDIVLSVPPCSNPEISYAAVKNVAVPVADQPIAVNGAGGNVEWSFDAIEADCGGGGTVAQCFGLSLTIPSGTVDAAVKATLAGTAPATDVGKEGFVTVNVTEAVSNPKSCSRRYRVHVIGDPPGGWGDPHLTTSDNVHYDFQSAGEFTALRQDRFEVQTRQTAVPTASVPGPNEYTGLATCVSIYTAVAARIGSNRVTLQPNLSGQRDPSGMQLRVNGRLVTVPENGLDLRAPNGAVEGRIRSGGGDGPIQFEITDVRGTQLVVTPAFWASQQTWYLNVNVYQTSAIKGTMGVTTDGWLPALRDGASLGQRPESPQERYEQLYEKFADSWRVTNATSLFDYAPGTNTATFTLDEWPRFRPESCEIQGRTAAQPTTPQVAEQACSGVTDPAQKADCIFDVTVTGETGFAHSYEVMQQFRPHGTGWQPVIGGQAPPPPQAPRPYRYAFSLHAGLTDPWEGLATPVDGDLMLEFDIERPLSERLALNAVIGHYSFDPDPDILGASLYLRGYLPQSNFRLFAEAGAGLFDGGSLVLGGGLSGGVGIDRALGGGWRGELGVHVFGLFQAGTNVKFLTYKVGLRRTF